MSLTRKGAKATGMTDEQVDWVIEAHTEVTNALNDTISQLREQLATITQERDSLRSDSAYRQKYEDEHAAFEAFKTDVATANEKAAKERAARDFFKSHKIPEQNMELAMLAAAGTIAGLELDGDTIKDTTALDALIADGGTLAGLIPKTVEIGAPVQKPVTTGAVPTKTKEEIFAIKDPAERQKAIAENHALFGI